MSLIHVQQEVRRFLTRKESEVLCLSGKWGVGKTYAWKTYINEVNSAGKLALNAYAYVSLFGLNSLDDLRFAVFENTVSADHVKSGPSADTFKALFAKSTDIGRRLRPIIDAFTSLMNRKGIGETFFRTAFLTVRNQLICFDDLERAGTGLEIRDVLGLASFLKEERGCKVALLLNDEKLNDADRQEFRRQLEKVADITLVLDPTPDEAAEIAFIEGEASSGLLRQRVIELGITNIRVIKRIQRLAALLTEILSDREQDTIDQALTAVALGSWSVQQPDVAPTLDFIRKYNTYLMSLKEEAGHANEQYERWKAALGGYPYQTTDELDDVVLDGVASGYFNEQRLREAALLIEARRKKSVDNAFSRVWQDMYHGSFTTEDDEFLDALYDAAIDDAEAISTLNINSAVRLLREMGRGGQADKVISHYVKVHSKQGAEFFDIADDPILRDQTIDVALQESFDTARANFVDDRDPLDVLRSMIQSQNWSKADVSLMAKQSADDFEMLFEKMHGTELRGSIELLQSMSRSGYEGSQAIADSITQALKRIGKKSPLRARKVARFGVDVTEGDPSN